MRSTHLKKLLVVLGVGLSLVVIMLAVVTWGPHLARDYLASRIESALGRRVTIGAIEVSPLRGRIRVEDLVVAGDEAAGRPMLSLPEGTATVDLSEALFGRLHILDAHLSSPTVRIARLKTSVFSFQDILDHSERPTVPAKEPFYFILEKASLEGGSLSVKDQVVGRDLSFTDIRASIEAISTRPDAANQSVAGKASFSFGGGAGELALQGIPFGKQANLKARLEASKLSLATLAPYLTLPRPLSVTGGTLATDIQVQYGPQPSLAAQPAASSPTPAARAANADKEAAGYKAGAVAASAAPPTAAPGAWSLTGGSLRVSQATLAAGDEMIANLQELSAEGLRIDPGSRYAGADALQIAGSRLTVTRDEKGRLLLEEWLSAAGTEGAAGESRWQYTLGSLDVKNLEVRFIDLGVPAQSRMPAATVNLQAEDLSSDLVGVVPLKASVVLDEGSQASLEGRLRPRPLKIDARVASGRFDVTHFEPYFGPFVNLDLVSGRLLGAGNLEVETDATIGLSRLGYVGKMSAEDVKAVDQVLETDFLRWSAVEVPSVTVDWKPALPNESRVEIGDMAITDFFGRVILDKNGELNLKHVLVRSDEALAIDVPDNKAAENTRDRSQAQGEQADAAAGPDVRIGTLRITRGQLSFTDNFVNPNYTADLTRLSGSVTGVSSNRPDPAEVDIHGFVNGNAPLEIQGHVNLLAQQPVLDLMATAQGIELTHLTPYAIGWAGYAIESGTLSADVRYRIRGTELDAENHLVLHQLRLGNKVESESASNLPLKLALSLLRDGNGNVTLNLPISGSLSNPEFSLPGLASQAISGLIRKAATAPFELLASLGGLSTNTAEPEPLNVIEFEPGQAKISDRQRTRLENLAQVLRGRPEVSLEIIGYADRSADLEALRHDLNPKSITDADLLILARRRGDTVRNALVEAGVTDGRLKLRAPRFAEGPGSLPPSRAELEIQVPDQSGSQDVG
jgi:Domain of Unknown Function (DUF748)/OmpA family